MDEHFGKLQLYLLFDVFNLLVFKQMYNDVIIADVAD